MDLQQRSIVWTRVVAWSGLLAAGWIVSYFWSAAPSSIDQLPDPLHPPRFRIDVNRATTKELELLPGVGPAMAQQMQQWRQEYGEVQQVDRLDDVPGLGPERLRGMRDYVVPTASPTDLPIKDPR
jgi:competence ComEA-like helix-hairpin-helix protein